MTVIEAPPHRLNGHTPTLTPPAVHTVTIQTPVTETSHQQKTPVRQGAWVMYGVAAALGVVIAAPILLSSQDLYAWAHSLRGLNLAGIWPYLVPISLDLAAVSCIGMTIVAVWRRDRPGIFGTLVWVFALTSAYAQYTHGLAERAAGRAQDAWWAMPAFALLGPLLLEVTLHRVRKWARQDEQEILTGAAGFGIRWMVAPWSTLSAWATSRREGIRTAPAALQFVSDRKALKGLNEVESLHYAFGSMGAVDPHSARVWLSARGVLVTQSAIDVATAHRPIAPPPSVSPNAGQQTVHGPDADPHAVRMDGFATNRDRIRYAFAALGTFDQAAADRWLRDRGIEVTRSEIHAVAKTEQTKVNTRAGK